MPFFIARGLGIPEMHSFRAEQRDFSNKNSHLCHPRRLCDGSFTALVYCPCVLPRAGKFKELSNGKSSNRSGGTVDLTRNMGQKVPAKCKGQTEFIAQIVVGPGGGG